MFSTTDSIISKLIHINGSVSTAGSNAAIATQQWFTDPSDPLNNPSQKTDWVMIRPAQITP